MKDYYALLGVERSSTKTEIKKNYRLLAAKFHPDKNSDPDAADKFIAVTEAYEVLSNKKSKIKYDLYIWEKLKREKESADSFNMVVPPFESTRVRRNRDQQKRGIKYQASKTATEKQIQLLIERLHIVGRYILPILGITLLVVFMLSTFRQLAPAFEKNIIRGIFYAALIAGIIFGQYWILSNTFLELNKDIKFFSIFYKITQKKAASILISIATFVLLLYLVFLVTFF